jgi:hypothetical protein
MRKGMLAVVGVAALAGGAGALGADAWEFAPETNLGFAFGRASEGVLADDSGTDTWMHEAAFSADLLWQRDLGNKRFLDLSFGAAASWIAQDEPSDIDPSDHAFRLTAEWDTPLYGSARRDGEGRRSWLTLGARIEEASADFGSVDFGDSSGVYLAALVTERRAPGGCELGSTLVFYETEDFDDHQNSGDPVFDRTDDGNYDTVGVEQSWVFGKIGNPKKCGRTGLFRRLVVYNQLNLRGGWTYRREATQGTLFDAGHHVFHFGGELPLARAGRLGLEGWTAITLSDYEERGDDEAIAGELSLRWAFGDGVARGLVRHLHLRGGLAAERRDSSVGEFDYDRWGAFVALDMRMGGPKQAGPITGGAAGVEERGGTNSSEPKVPSETGP